MKVTVAIVNYRSAALTIACLETLYHEVAAMPTLRVVVADNASGDDSVAILRDAIASRGWSDWARVLPLPRNGGFAYGNNAVIREALTDANAVDAVLLLNPDTLVRPGAISTMVKFMREHPQAGLVGSRLEDPDGTPHRTAHRDPSPLGEMVEGARIGLLSRIFSKRVVSPPVSTDASMCQWLSGASLLVRREVFEQIGMMDEGYFLYFEEVDFCRRAVRAGWQAWYVPDARVVHLEGQITAANRPDRPRPTYWFDSRRRFMTRHYGVTGLILADLFWLLGRGSLLIRRVLRLGGSMAGESRRVTLDMLTHDLRALVSSSYWKMAREKVVS